MFEKSFEQGLFPAGLDLMPFVLFTEGFVMLDTREDCLHESFGV